jgi:hypothetical protein
VDIAAQPGQDIGRDIGRGEAVEHELDAFISKRHEQRLKTEGERPIEEAWRERERESAARRPTGERSSGAAGLSGIGAWSAATWSGLLSAGGGRTPWRQTQQPNGRERHDGDK